MVQCLETWVLLFFSCCGDGGGWLRAGSLGRGPRVSGQDPRNCNYYGNKEVGRFLWDLLSLGATRDWRQVIQEKTGEEVSTRTIREYFQPLMEYLEKENAGRKVSW